MKSPKRFLAKNSGIFTVIFSVFLGLMSGYYTSILSGSLKVNDNHEYLFLESFFLLKWWNLLLLFILILLVAQVYVGQISKKYTKLHLSEVVYKMLEAACQSLVYPRNQRHIRAIVTIREEDLVRKTKFSYNTSSDPERVAKFPLYFGVTGQAYLTRSVVLKELSVDHHSAYDSNTKNNVLPEIRTILAAPILDPIDLESEPLGVLAFDSKLALKTLGWDQDRVRKIAQDWADIIGYLIIYSDF